MKNSGPTDLTSPFQRLQGILEKQSLRPMKATMTSKTQHKMKKEAHEAHKYFIKNIEQKFASKKMFENHHVGGNWQDLLAKTPTETNVTQQKGKVNSSVVKEVNTLRTLIPSENKEEAKENPKRKMFREKSTTKSHLFGEGKDMMTKRYEAAKNRRLNTLKNFEENSDAWGRDTPKVMQEIANGVADYKTPKKKKKTMDPRLKKKIEKMEEGKEKLEKIMKNSPINGGPKKKKRTIKKFNKFSKRNQRSDIHFNSKKCIGKEKQKVRGKKKVESELVNKETNNNGFLEKFKNDRDSTAPFLYPVNMTRTVKKRKRPCKRQHPVKNVSYGFRGCVEHPTAKKTGFNRRTGSMSTVSNGSTARSIFHAQMRSSIFS